MVQSSVAASAIRAGPISQPDEPISKRRGSLTERFVSPPLEGGQRARDSAIRAFVAAHNADGRPFIWIKTADEILASIARFAQRTFTLVSMR